MKTVLVDDEPLALDILESKLKAYENIEVIAKCAAVDVDEHEALLEEADCLFLDIHLTGTNGIELAKHIQEAHPCLFLVFVTAYDYYAVQAFELNAVDYLLKPIHQTRVEKTVRRIERYLEHRETQETSDSLLHIKLFGELSFQIGTHSEKLKWRTNKARELFAYFLHHHGRTVPKSEIIFQFWPEGDGDRSLSQLYTTIYHIRKRLEEYQDYLSLKSMNGGYILETNHVTIDIVEWETNLKKLAPLSPDTITDYERVMKHYTGTYLEKDDYLWADAERLRLEELWHRTAFSIAAYYYKEQEPSKAERWLKRICNVFPEDEKANLLLMKVFAESDQSVMVMKQYDQLKAALDELCVEVSDETSAWYEQWRKSR
ncbi:UNVERIFIED_CONTAM: response regulator [Halobacillus marinus]